MSATKKLALRRETLSDLTTEEMRGVVGGAPSGTTCPVKACLNSDYNCLLPTREGCTPALPG